MSGDNKRAIPVRVVAFGRISCERECETEKEINVGIETEIV